MSSTQDSPISWHAHVPPSHSIQPQQSLERSHSTVGPRQQVGTPGDGMHCVLSQQLPEPGVHICPTGVHSLEQKSRSHSRFPSQVNDGRQQICPSCPHSKPSKSITVPIPMHMFVRNGSQIDPNAHVSPEQHGCPSPPHSDPSVPGAGSIIAVAA